MLIYFVCLIISLVCASIAAKSQTKRARILAIILSMAPFILLAALRSYNVGIDTWKNYGSAYTSIALYGDRFDIWEFLLVKYEIGFSALVFILSKICTDPIILFSICAIIIIGFTYVAIFQQSKKVNYSIVIFFLSGAFLLSMNGMRSYAAVAIVLYALKYIPTRKFFHFFGFLFLATLIHRSVLIFAVFYPLYSINFKPKHLLCAIGISIIALPLIPVIAQALLSSTPYINYFNGTKNFVDPLWSMLIINIFLFCFYLFNYYKTSKKDQLCAFYLKIQTLSVIVCIASFILPQSYRVEQIIDYVQILSIPYNLYMLRNVIKLKKSYYFAFSSIILLIFGTYFTNSFILHDNNVVRDYSSIIESWGEKND